MFISEYDLRKYMKPKPGAKYKSDYDSYDLRKVGMYIRAITHINYYTIENQKLELIQDARKFNWEYNLCIEKDNREEDLNKRFVLRRLLSDIKRKKFEALVVCHGSVLSQSIEDFQVIKNILIQADCILISNGHIYHKEELMDMIILRK